MPRVETGLDVLIGTPQMVGGRKWALLANHAAVTADLDPARASLLRAEIGPLVRLFAPEHGLDGIAQDHEAVSNQVDRLTGAEIRSLYGSSEQTLAPAAADLEDIDVLIVDLPDIGTRYYTFAATMDFVMAASERAAIEVMVLDRPNPIGGRAREGGAVRRGFESFVSQLPTPVRHGMTIGEIALLLRRERYPQLELSVIPCQGWVRREWWDATGLPWVPPSPNMPILETAALYPGLCLVEATELSEGRGTTRPFHLVGAPWVDGECLTRRMRRLELDGVGFRTAIFRPEFGKHAGEVCQGVEIHVEDREALQPLALGVHLLDEVHKLDPGQFTWRADPYEFVSEVPAIDLLTGSEAARLAIESGGSVEQVLDGWRREVDDFEKTLEGLLLHHDDD